ncbi:hypothetical protein [Erysipelothrix larvae]|nr:hypothetical protein [Erysipelothrix larvae]
MNKISEESFSQACNVITEHGTDIFFESKQTKKIRQVKFWLLVIVLAAISVDNLLVYLTLGSYTLLSFYECFRLSKEWKNNKLVYVLVLKYCILAVVLLCLTFPLLYFDYIPAAIFSLLFSDFPFFQIRWLVYKSKLEEINTKM